MGHERCGGQTAIHRRRCSVSGQPPPSPPPSDLYSFVPPRRGNQAGVCRVEFHGKDAVGVACKLRVAIHTDVAGAADPGRGTRANQQRRHGSNKRQGKSSRGMRHHHECEEKSTPPRGDIYTRAWKHQRQQAPCRDRQRGASTGPSCLTDRRTRQPPSSSPGRRGARLRRSPRPSPGRRGGRWSMLWFTVHKTWTTGAANIRASPSRRGPCT